MRNPLNPSGQTDRDREEEAVLAAQQVLQMLDPLVENPEFQAFWKIFGEQAVLKYKKIALDPTTEAGARDTAAKLHHVLNEWYEWPMIQRAEAIKRIREAEKREAERRATLGQKKHPVL